MASLQAAALNAVRPHTKRTRPACVLRPLGNSVSLAPARLGPSTTPPAGGPTRIAAVSVTFLKFCRISNGKGTRGGGMAVATDTQAVGGGAWSWCVAPSRRAQHGSRRIGPGRGQGRVPLTDDGHAEPVPGPARVPFCIHWSEILLPAGCLRPGIEAASASQFLTGHTDLTDSASSPCQRCVEHHRAAIRQPRIVTR